VGRVPQLQRHRHARRHHERSVRESEGAWGSRVSGRRGVGAWGRGSEGADGGH